MGGGGRGRQCMRCTVSFGPLRGRGVRGGYVTVIDWVRGQSAVILLLCVPTCRQAGQFTPSRANWVVPAGRQAGPHPPYIHTGACWRCCICMHAPPHLRAYACGMHALTSFACICACRSPPSVPPPCTPSVTNTVTSPWLTARMPCSSGLTPCRLKNR